MVGRGATRLAAKRCRAGLGLAGGGLGLAGAALAASLALTGCSTTSGPTDTQIKSITLPPTTPVSPNNASATGGCALITPEQVSTATHTAITRTSNIGAGCAWSDDTGGKHGMQLVAGLRVLASDENGDSARDFAYALAKRQSDGPVVPVPGLGEQAFTSDVGVPTVWWQQGQSVYSIAIELAPAYGVGVDAAVELARIASGNIPS